MVRRRFYNSGAHLEDSVLILLQCRTSIRPLPGTHGSSILRSQINFSPTLLSTQSDSASDHASSDLLNQQSGLLTELILGAYHKAAGLIYTIVENKLMGEQLKQKQSDGADS